MNNEKLFLMRNKIESNLEQILISLNEIERFYIEVKDNASIRLMATRAIERDFEIIFNAWSSIKRYDSNIALENISDFIRVGVHSKSAYLRTPEKLIWSIVETKVQPLKKEVKELLSDYNE